MALPLLHNSQQCLRQGYRSVSEVEEVVGEKYPAPAQVGASILLAMHAWAKRRGAGCEVVDRVAEASVEVGAIHHGDLARKFRLREPVIVLHRHLLGHEHGVHDHIRDIPDRRHCGARTDDPVHDIGRLTDARLTDSKRAESPEGVGSGAIVVRDAVGKESRHDSFTKLDFCLYQQTSDALWPHESRLNTTS